MLAALCSVAMTSCDDWTEPESVDINYGTIDQAPDYQAYLESLRAYRASDHKKVYAWVSLPVTGPQNQSHRLTALPDSIDVVVIETPEEIHPTCVADIKSVRTTKAMEVIYCVDFDALKADYTALCEELAGQRDLLTPDPETGEVTVPAELEDPEFNDWMLAQLTAKLALVKSNNFTGVMFAFNGRSTSHMQPADLKVYMEQQLMFMSVASDWHQRNPDYTFDFMGYPQFVEDKSIFDEFRMLFLRQGLEATNSDLYTYYLTKAAEEGVPTEKLAMMSTFTSNDELDVTTGVFSDGSRAIDAIGAWANANPVCGIGIQLVQNDYFNAGTYPAVRNAIQELNPSIK